MNPDALTPLTVSKESDILMKLMEELKSAVNQLLPLLDLLKAPQGDEEQDMIRRLLTLMKEVESELGRSTAWHEDFEARQLKIEENQTLVLRHLDVLNSKVTEIHEGFMPLVSAPQQADG